MNQIGRGCQPRSQPALATLHPALPVTRIRGSACTTSADVRLALEGAFEAVAPDAAVTPRLGADVGGSTRAVVGVLGRGACVRDCVADRVGAVACGDAGGSSAGAAGRRFGHGCVLARPGGSGEQRRHLSRRHAAGLRLGHTHEAVHAPAGSTEGHRACRERRAPSRRSSRRTGSGSDSSPVAR